MAGLPIDSNPVQAWKIGTDDVIVTTNDSIDIFRHVVEKVKDTNGNETKETKEVTKLIKSIKDYKLSKTQPKINVSMRGIIGEQIAYTNDGTLAFIINPTNGVNDKILIMDTQTLEIVYELKIPGLQNMSSLIVDNDWLYVSAGGYSNGKQGKLVRVNIDQLDRDFLTKQQTIDFGYAPENGFWDMAINNGSYLALTAPTSISRYSYGGTASPSGNVYVFDLNDINELGEFKGKVVVLDSAKLGGTSGNKGKLPQYISSGTGDAEFVLSNSRDRNSGLMTIKLQTDDKGKSRIQIPSATHL